MATVFTREVKPGSAGDVTLTWDDMLETWDDVLGTWDNPRQLDATGYTKENKPTSSFTDESKPTTSFTDETKP